MTTASTSWRRLIALLALLAVVGCGGAAAGVEQAPEVPRLSVARLDGDGEFALARLASSSSPTLLWFWAPWCPYCNEEAAAIERLAADGRGELTVVAIGGQDSRANALDFTTEHGLRTPLLLFDESEAASDAYKVPAVPTAVLLDRSGRERERWVGGFDTAEALELAREL